jgi:hypothetical protein
MQDITHSYRIVAADLFDLILTPKVSIFEHGYLLDYSIEQDQKLDFEKKVLVYTTFVTVTDKNKNEVLLTFKTACLFEVKEFELSIQVFPERQFQVTDAVNDSMTRISIGATRGLMSAHLKNTYLASAMLPLLPFEF